MTTARDASPILPPRRDAPPNTRSGEPSIRDFQEATEIQRRGLDPAAGVDPESLLLLPFAVAWHRSVEARLMPMAGEVVLTNLSELRGRFLGFLWRRAGQPARRRSGEGELDREFFHRVGVHRTETFKRSVDYEAPERLEERLLEFKRVLPRWWSLLAEVTANSSAFVCEIVARSELARATLGWAESDGPLRVSIEPWLSDPHNGNRTTARVLHPTGDSWYYKPRPLDMETVMVELQARARAIFPGLFSAAAPRSILAGNHGWMQPVPSCRNLPARARDAYFARAGALLALIRTVGGMDFYRDNVVCDPDGWLVPVDSECLFADASADGGGPRGVLDTGMLPIPARRLGPKAAGIAAGFLDLSDDVLTEVFRAGMPTLKESFRRCRLSLSANLGRWLEDPSLRVRWTGLRRRHLRVGTLGYYAAIERSLSPENLGHETDWRHALRQHLSAVSPGTTAETAAVEDLGDLARLDIPHRTHRIAVEGDETFERVARRLSWVNEAWIDKECQIISESMTSPEENPR